MKSSMILGLAIIGIVCTSIISFASDIKILSKNKVDYIPVKNIIQKLGGKVDISGNNAKIIIDGKSIVIDKNLSFAKVDDEYYPLNTKKINGIEVPVDTDPIFEKDEVYIEKDFLKNYKIINYTIKEGNIKVVLDKEKSNEQNLEKDRNEKKEKMKQKM
ncbi:copper amine oxidase N-terminal domain protein [[Clostridium] sordellii ATCC 9714]|nr:copper amine oxidase N-terminal domain protein [[Clostridium] sordellii ATCC 9714] [Paeniclostridium sordellii ATCC 9714]